jgi:hypothetical protein
VSVLEQAIDDLYRLPLGDFTAARNRLAKTLAGTERERVRTLEKPAVVPWAVNQLYWRARPAYDRVLKAGAALRAAQIDALEGRPGRVPKASSAHRQALADATTRALALAMEHDVRPAAEPLSRMLEALSLSPAPPDPGGRLTEVIQLSGFEALAGVRPAAPAPAPAPASRGPSRDKASAVRRDDAADAEQLERQRAQAAEALKDAERSLAAAREREARERGRVATARAQLGEAEAALESARADVEACEAALRTARTAAHRARV